MTLGISKAYTPGSGDVANSTSYNTDIAALFNAFSGLEAQTSTLGGLTITPTANGTTVFKITNAAATELLRIDTTNSRVGLKATGRLNLDGATSETYLTESADNVFDVYTGGTNYLKITHASTKVEVLGSHLEIDATKQFFLDGGGDTYIQESGADVLDIYVGGANMIKCTESTADTVAISGVMTITPNTSTDALTITQANDKSSIVIDSESAIDPVISIACCNGITVTQDVTNGFGLNITRNIAEVGTTSLVYFKDDHATSTQNVLDVNNDGTGRCISAISTGASYTLYVQGNGYAGVCGFFFNDGNNANREGIEIQCGTDDNSGTNVHIQFADGSGDVVGNVTSSGGTVAYNAFTGGHPNPTVGDKEYDMGTVMVISDIVEHPKKHHFKDCSQPKFLMAPCRAKNDKKVFGVYAGRFKEEHQIYGLGDGVILVCSANGNIESGDYLTTSDVEGYAMKQDSEQMMNYTIAKACESVDWSKEKSDKKRIACTYHAS